MDITTNQVEVCDCHDEVNTMQYNKIKKWVLEDLHNNYVFFLKKEKTVKR